MAPSSDRLQGSLDLLILRTLQTGPLHGWAIAQRLQILSHDLFQPNQGSLYPALHRLEDRGWIRAEWGTSDRQRRARFYRLTAAGQRQLDREASAFSRSVTAISRVLRGAEA